MFLAAAGWTLFVSAAVRAGARFATPTWHIVTQGTTAALMLYFAIVTVHKLALGA